jgi:D-alanyl-D-alanine carboxypeptidase
MSPSHSPERLSSGRRISFSWVAVVLVAAVGIVIALRWASGDPAADPAASPSSAASAGAPTSTATASPATLREPPPCELADRPTVLSGYEDWNETLLDTAFRLPQDYAPPDLVSAGQAGFSEGFLVRDVLIADLAALRRAAEDAGTPVDLIAAYRSFAQQADLFERRVAELGEAVALAKTARPGHSEHQLGTAVDFKTPGRADVTVAWASSPPGKWMKTNGTHFGFLESYPEGKRDLTCYAYEPWHYRYVGRQMAADVVDSGLTLREYLWHWQETGTPP